MSIGYGVFWGIVPLWGYQMLCCVSTALLFRLNATLAAIASNISIPPMIPLILYLSFLTGGLCLGDTGADLSLDKFKDFDVVIANLYQYVIGAVVLAVVVGLLTTLTTFVLLEYIFKRKSKRP